MSSKLTSSHCSPQMRTIGLCHSFTCLLSQHSMSTYVTRDLERMWPPGPSSWIQQLTGDRGSLSITVVSAEEQRRCLPCWRRVVGSQESILEEEVLLAQVHLMTW